MDNAPSGCLTVRQSDKRFFTENYGNSNLSAHGKVIKLAVTANVKNRYTL